MEPPMNDIRPQVSSLGNRTPLRGVEDLAECNPIENCYCEKNDRNDALSKEEQESTDIYASKTTEEAFHSTPLRVGCCRRQSSHSNGSCGRSNSLRTPVNNAGKTPLKVPRNPFDAVLLDRLHLPICSPSIFTNVKSEKEDEFRWNIEQQAILFPAPIEEEFDRYHHAYEQYDPETESKLQAAIDRFYESKLIAPSPWTDTKKNGFVRTCSSVTKVFPGNLYSRTRDSDSFSLKSSKLSPRKHNVGTQTEISLPFNLPPELENMLRNYKLPSPPKEESISAMESESFSTSSLRRKLFSHMEEMSITQSPCQLGDKAQASPSHCNLATIKAFTPDKHEPPSPYFHHGSETDEEDVQDFLESSQTTFWRNRCSPTISPISKEGVSKISKDKTGQKKSTCDPTSTEFTPPSSRSKHKPIFPINFTPLLEMEEDYENIEMNDILKNNYSDKNPSQAGGIKDLTSRNPQNHEMLTKERQNREMIFGTHDMHSNFTSVFSRTEILVDQKADVTSISNQVQAQERVYSMEVSDCGTSHTHDTGYQTGNTTSFPSSMSFNFSKTRTGLGMSTDAAAMIEKGAVKSKVCEDGYMSITSIKLPLVTEYDDESMCDAWHATPPMASSTPAKTITGLLM